MPPRRLRVLIIGLALFILGPVLGFCIYVFLLLHAFPGPTLTLSDALLQLQKLPTQLTIALLPIALGLLSGASGLFMVISSLAIHFLGSEAKTSAAPQHRSESTAVPKPAAPKPTFAKPAAVEVTDDSRYMPKYR